MRKPKIYINDYYCPKCNMLKHISSDEEFDGICKCCKGKMQFGHEIDMRGSNPQSIFYNPKPQAKNCPQQPNAPKCPTCQSTNLKRISTTAKAVNTITFGLLGTKRHKTFHCNSCGYEW